MPGDVWQRVWSKARQKKVGMFSLAQRAAKQRNATCNAAGRAIRREAGQRGRATRLPGESQGVDVGSGCELTPSTVLAEVSSSRRAPRRPCEGPSCYKLHVAELLLHNHPSHTRAITRAVHCGSFASIPLICRQSEREKQAIASHNSLLETSITTCLARRPRAPRHTSGTSRRLFRNRESERTKSASVAGGPGDFAIISLARPPSPSLLPPFRAPFLPPSLSPSATVSQGIRKYPSAHTHRPGNVYASCEITFTTRHSEHTFTVVILSHRHPLRTLQATCDRDAILAATSLVSHQCTAPHAYPLDSHSLLPPVPIAYKCTSFS